MKRLVFFLSSIALCALLILPTVSLFSAKKPPKIIIEGGEWVENPNTLQKYLGFSSVEKNDKETICAGDGNAPCPALNPEMFHTITSDNKGTDFKSDLFKESFESLFARIQNEFLWKNTLLEGVIKSPVMHMYTIDGTATYVVVHAKWVYDAETKKGEVNFSVIDLG